MKKTIMALFMSGIIMTTGIPVLANNCRDTYLPSKVVSFSYSTSAYTELRDKTDASSHYIYNQSGFVERFPELSPFFKACRAFYDEMICIFPYFCPYAESAREIRGIFVALHQ